MSANTSQFIHLNVHSEFSLVDGIVRIPKLADKLVDENMPAVALTDASNLFEYWLRSFM